MLRAALSALLLLSLGACSTLSPSAESGPPTGVPVVLNPVANLDPVALLVNSATSMLGQPYRYGGAGPGGFDCSGLVEYAARNAGISLPRTAQEQMTTGTSVARAELQPGDLVFLHLTRKELHVGLALGADRFIHAPSRGRNVRIDSLAAAPYSKGFFAARRIIASPTPPK